ncbi:MAG TPA: secretin N-terminal domain-containing protein [Burkholderiaceae bacterium]|nr:secretin N-terminal domain-containing protein [Burkholderiaceae bacterium]
MREHDAPAAPKKRSPMGHGRHPLASGRRGVAMALASLLLVVGGCADVALRDSDDMWRAGHYEDAVARLRDASQKHPGDHELRAAYLRLRDRTATQLAVAGDGERQVRHYDEAVSLYQRALALAPDFDRARAGIDAVAAARRHDAAVAEAQRLADAGDVAGAESRLRAVLAEDAGHGPARRLLLQLRARQVQAGTAPAALRSALTTPVSLDFHDTPLRSVFEALSRTAGINFIFDRDVRTDTKVTLAIRNNSVEDAIRLLLATSGLERKILNDNSLLIYPSNQAKAREYQDQVVRTFYLVNADAKQAQNMLRTLARTKDIFIDEKLNMVAVRDTPDAVRLAEQLIAAFDVAEAEVMLEVEVMEISHQKVLDLGLNFPTQVNVETTTPFTPTGTSGTTTTTSEINLRNRNLTTTIANPALRLNLLSTDTDTNLLANPRIRVKNREKAKVQVGEKLPVFSSTAVQGAGVASSVSYIDVGLKLEVEPQVTLDDEVTMKVNLEVSSNLGTVNSTSSAGTTTGFELGTRSAQTTLRVHDGETQVLGGLINDNLTDVFSKLPGFGDIPGFGRLFGDSSINREKSEIVLLITPHIIRNLAPPDFDAQYLPAGTESAIGAMPLAIGPTPPRSLALSADGAGAAPAAPFFAPMRRGGRAGALEPAVPIAPPDSAAIAAADAATATPLVTLQAPGQVSLGHDLTIAVEVQNPVAAIEGDVVLGFNPSQFQAAGQAGGAGGSTLTVHVTGGPGGALTGSATLRALNAGTGAGVLAVTDGHLRLADGSDRPVAAGASASVAIVP